MKTQRIEELLAASDFPDWGKEIINTALTKDCVKSYLVLTEIAQAFDERSQRILGMIK